jgi:PTH1 family peptidyl-tRNA hydrolase
VVGLGNPGHEYVVSRHNIGFVLVERLAARWCILLAPEAQVIAGKGRIGGVSVALIQPQTFMNRSGEALRAYLGPRFSGEMIVVHDDIDLPVGRLRIRRDGGAGGHRGVASIIEHLGPAFDRLKFGVGRPPAGIRVTDYVLAPVTGGALVDSGWGVERAVDALECWIVRGVERAMNRYNTGPIQ